MVLIRDPHASKSVSVSLEEGLVRGVKVDKSDRLGRRGAIVSRVCFRDETCCSKSARRSVIAGGKVVG